MPREKIQYAKTEIYKIVPKDQSNKFIHFGATTNFTKQKNNIIKNSKDENKRNALYDYIRTNGGMDQFQMIFVEKSPCNNKREQEARLDYWNNKTINSNEFDFLNQQMKDRGLYA